MDGMRMARSDKPKDRLKEAVRKSRYTIHRPSSSVAFVEKSAVDGKSSNIETLIRVEEGYQVISLNKEIDCEIIKDKTGRLKCTCYLGKPCKHLLALDMELSNGIQPPTLQDLLGEMIDIERR